MSRIGLVPMAAKPYHAGHDLLVRLAVHENDAVYVYASMADRDEVSGKAMEQIWKELIEPTLPANVKVEYVTSPVGQVFATLGEANKSASSDVFSIYSDPTDVNKNFKTLDRYAADLLANGQIKLRGVDRSSTVNVSGTQMRKWLADGDKDSFIAHLPKKIDGEKVWSLLTTTKPESKSKKTAKPATKKAPASKGTKSEGLLRSYIRLALDDK